MDPNSQRSISYDYQKLDWSDEIETWADYTFQ
jgi:hypothetical protein